MGAVDRQGNGQMKNKKKNGVTKNFVGKKIGQRIQPPFNSVNTFPPFAQGMRARPPFPPGRMPPPGMGPVPPPGPRMPPGPPPLFRTRVPPPRGMGPRALMQGPPGPPPPPPPQMNMRPRPPGLPLRPPPPPLMRPPLMGRFPPRGPPPQIYPNVNKMRQLKNKIINKKTVKKKQNTQNQFDLTSPWVTEEIRAAFTKKDELLAKAKAAPEATKTADWNAFKEQRAKCDKLYKTAKMDYIGKHPEEIIEDISESSSEDEFEEARSDNFCDTCERTFYDSAQLQKHLQKHRVCGIDGCTYVAHEKVVEKHIEMLHVTGLYYRVKKTETPEDVAKWIKDRKRRYPTKENIEKRQKEQQEMLKRGERLQKPNSRFGKRTKKVLGKPKFSHGKILNDKRNPKQRRIFKTPKVSESFKDNWKGDLPPFGGTKELYESEDESRGDVEISDDEWMSERQEATKIVLNNALGALIGAYRSSDESDDEIVVPKVETESKVEEKSNDDAPEEVKISREEPRIPNTETEVSKTEKQGRKRKRKHQHIKVEKKQVCNTQVRQKNDKPEKRWRKITLLERLLEPEIRHERNVILQCVRFVVKSNFFDKTVSVPSTDSSPNEAREELKDTKVEDGELEDIPVDQNNS